MKAFAFSFDCDLSFFEILTQLNERGPWEWAERDSAWYGNLASARTPTLRLDLIESGPNNTPGGSVDAGNGQRYCISVRPNRDVPTAAEWKSAASAVRELLILLGARNPQPTDTID